MTMTVVAALQKQNTWAMTETGTREQREPAS
jgi:hypothetical protein